MHCTTTACTSTDTPQTLDSAGGVGWYPSITIGTDGMPIIAYYDATNGDLKVVHCTTTACTSTDTPQTLDTTDNVGRYPSITIGTDGMPIIAYRNVTNGGLKVVHCTTAACTSSDTPQNLDSAGIVGPFMSLAIGTDGMPIIAHTNITNGDLKVVHCTTTACTSTDTPQTLDTTGWYPSIAIGIDGKPVIAYHDGTNYDLKVVHCTTTACTNTDTPQTLDTTGNVGLYTAIAIGIDGLPMIAYYDDTNYDLKVAQVR